MLTSPSPPTSPQWKYDVFVSFRGKDLRRNFISHLFSALRQASIQYFSDNAREDIGEEIKSKLFKAIWHARIALIVFSRNYADSRWCMNELVEILECKKRFRNYGHLVVPIFHEVNAGDISKFEGGSEFSQGFERLCGNERDEGQIQKWRDALRETKQLSGFDLGNDAGWEEGRLVAIIVEYLVEKIRKTWPLYFVKDAIGVELSVDDVISLIRMGQTEDVRVIGICGVKGIGKTTVAEVICECIRHDFECFVFLDKVGEADCNNLVLLGLQKKLLHDLIKVEGSRTYDDIQTNIKEIKSNMFRKRILLVLDDVTRKNQIDYFGAGKRELLCPGSRILITTRDQNLLKDLKVDDKYIVKGLDPNDALRLFCRHALKREEPQEGYEDLSRGLAHYAGGHPLSLKRLGSFLNGKSKDQWDQTLEKLVRDPHLDSVGLPLEPFSSVLPFQSVGPYGGRGGDSFDDKTYTDVRNITVFVTSVIESFYIEYDQNGSLVRSPRHGRSAEGKICTVQLDYPNEFLTSVSGYIKDGSTFVVIQSLTFHSNRRTYGPFGNERGKFFSFPPVAGKIIGFFGRCGLYLDSIGAYLLPISHRYPFEVVGPFGNSNYEGRWDDDKHSDVRQIDVVSGSAIESITFTYEQGRSFAHGTSAGGTTNKINLDWSIEYLTSVSGYITSDFLSTIIHSLTFQSNKRTYGPFSTKIGRKFSFPATGGKIIGFYGSSSSHLQSLGAYFEPVSHLYPIEFIGPFGGQGGHHWDDGKFNGVKKIKMMLEDVVSYISFEYDDNGESIWSSTHGQSGNGDIHMVNLDYPREFLISVSGYIRHDNSVIQSLTFESNIRRHGPFGKVEGSFFICALTCSKIIGFHGRSGVQLDALGVYSEPISDLHLLKSIGPFGGQGGGPWDDGYSTGVRKIIVKGGFAIDSITVEYDKNGSVDEGPKHGGDGGHLTLEIKLDYPREYLTSFSGHYGFFGHYNIVRSLTFQSNERTFGPFGEEVGKCFSFPSTSKKIVGFHGRSGLYVDSLGAHFES